MKISPVLRALSLDNELPLEHIISTLEDNEPRLEGFPAEEIEGRCERLELALNEIEQDQHPLRRQILKGQALIQLSVLQYNTLERALDLALSSISSLPNDEASLVSEMSSEEKKCFLLDKLELEVRESFEFSLAFAFLHRAKIMLNLKHFEANVELLENLIQKAEDLFEKANDDKSRL